MKLAVVSVGTRMPAWLEQGWSDYAKRMPPHLPLDLIEIEPGAPKKPHPAGVEADRMRRAVPERAHRVALDAGPKPWSTEHLVTQLEAWLQVGDPVCFLIGGADGLDSGWLQQADQCWSLGPAVFPHMLVRVLVAEQLYRAWTITQGHPYHRGGS